MSTWLPGFEPIPIVGASGGELAGGSYVELTRSGLPAPWRLVMHTTETVAPLEALVAGYGRTRNYPHITADLVARRKAQHVDLDRSVTTAKNAPGGVETNRLHAVQVELIALAAEADRLSESTLQWIGAEIIAPICAAKGISPDPYADVGMDGRDGYIARPDGPTRMSLDEWERFAGVCAHQNVPENDHWDCGRLNLGHACAAARFVLSPAVASLRSRAQEDDMPRVRIIRHPGTGEIALPVPELGIRRRFPTEQGARDAVAANVAEPWPDGQAWHDVDPGLFEALPTA